MSSRSRASERGIATFIAWITLCVLLQPVSAQLAGEVTFNGAGSASLLTTTFVPTAFETPVANSWIFTQQQAGYFEFTTISVLHEPGDPASIWGVCVESFTFDHGNKLWCANDPFDVSGVEIQGSTVTITALTLAQQAPAGEDQSLVMDGVLVRPEVVSTEHPSLGTVKSWFSR